MNKTTLGQLIRSRREEKGYSQEKLAELCDLSDKAISKIELDISKPKAHNLCAICKALEMDIGELEAVYFEEGSTDEIQLSLH